MAYNYQEWWNDVNIMNLEIFDGKWHWIGKFSHNPWTIIFYDIYSLKYEKTLHSTMKVVLEQKTLAA